MKRKRALLIAAHGSRRPQSNDEIKHLANRVQQQVAANFDWVEHAFLELTEPSIESGIDRCVELGAQEVVVLPYFLSAGRHVAEDIPAIVQAKQAQYRAQEIAIRLTNYLGASQIMPELVLETALAQHCACERAIADCAYPDCQLLAASQSVPQ